MWHTFLLLFIQLYGKITIRSCNNNLVDPQRYLSYFINHRKQYISTAKNGEMLKQLFRLD